jgi:hypothetical protein
MKRFLLPCDCSARIEVTAGQAGDRVRCPACGDEQTVPRLGDLGGLEVAPDDVRPRRRWTVGHACCLAGMLIAAVASGGAIALRSWATGGPLAADDDIRAAVAATDIGAVHQAWALMARSGVERPPLPEEARSQRIYRSADAFARLLWTIAAGGAALAAAGLILSRSQPASQSQRVVGEG